MPLNSLQEPLLLSHTEHTRNINKKKQKARTYLKWMSKHGQQVEPTTLQICDFTLKIYNDHCFRHLLVNNRIKSQKNLQHQPDIDEIPFRRRLPP